MAFIFLDGCDAYANTGQISDKWSSVSSLALAATSGIAGGGAIQYNNGSLVRTIAYSISSSIAFNFGFWVKGFSTSTGEDVIVTLNTDQGNYSLLNVTRSATNLYIFTQFDGSTKAFGSANVCDGNYHWIEVSILLTSGSGGYIKVEVDGVSDINYSGVTIVSGPPTIINSLTYTLGNVNAASSQAYSDDYYIWDGSGATFNTFPLGPQRIQTLVPNANGDVDQYTPSAGMNYSCVNQGYASTTYVSDASTGNTDLYKYPGLSFSPAAIVSVVANYYAQNSGTGTAHLFPTVKTSGTTHQNAAFTLSVGTPVNYQGNFDTDAIGLTWNTTSVNNSQFGQGD